RARRNAHVITSRKKPERRRYAVTIIMPNSSTRGGASTAGTASGHRTRHRPGPPHPRRADYRHAGSIDPESRDAAERQPDVGSDESRERDRPTPLARGHGPKHTCARKNALLELRFARHEDQIRRASAGGGPAPRRPCARTSREGREVASNGIRDRVAIVGMGCTPFGEHWDKGVNDLLVDSTKDALASAG